MCKSWSFNDYCTTTNNTFNNNDLGHLNLTLIMNIADHVRYQNILYLAVLKLVSSNFSDTDLRLVMFE